jgi:hypothetical protein
MPEMFKYRVHWKHRGTVYLDEYAAASRVEAVDYFNDHRRPDVSLVAVELVGPDEGGVREFAHAPDSPFSPLMARRRAEKDENAR